MEVTGTNLPTQQTHPSLGETIIGSSLCGVVTRVHCAVSLTAHHLLVVVVGDNNDVSVVIAAGVRPVPFRTRKLSLFALMVLHL